MLKTRFSSDSLCIQPPGIQGNTFWQIWKKSNHVFHLWTFPKTQMLKSQFSSDSLCVQPPGIRRNTFWKIRKQVKQCQTNQTYIRCRTSSKNIKNKKQCKFNIFKCNFNNVKCNFNISYFKVCLKRTSANFATCLYH